MRPQEAAGQAACARPHQGDHEAGEPARHLAGELHGGRRAAEAGRDREVLPPVDQPEEAHRDQLLPPRRSDDDGADHQALQAPRHHRHPGAPGDGAEGRPAGHRAPQGVPEGFQARARPRRGGGPALAPAGEERHGLFCRGRRQRRDHGLCVLLHAAFVRARQPAARHALGGVHVLHGGQHRPDRAADERRAHPGEGPELRRVQRAGHSPESGVPEGPQVWHRGRPPPVLPLQLPRRGRIEARGDWSHPALSSSARTNPQLRLPPSRTERLWGSSMASQAWCSPQLGSLRLASVAMCQINGDPFSNFFPPGGGLGFGKGPRPRRAACPQDRLAAARCPLNVLTSHSATRSMHA
mmetsp:Transcript_25415/g.60439  ORF Transcript_25415/g.60439 Transcript_25415/m.60439 type:complete len:353 (-) Transcript_25415:31-1089(-)